MVGHLVAAIEHAPERFGRGGDGTGMPFKQRKELMLARQKPYAAENPMAIIYKHKNEPIPAMMVAVR